MSAYKVLVCGGRDFADRGLVFAALDAIAAKGPVHIIQGGAEGADGLAREWAQSRYVTLTTYHANWRKHGKGAGPIRNAVMLRESVPHVVIAFPGGRGTADMVRRAKLADVPVEMIEAATSRNASLGNSHPISQSAEGET